MPNIQQLREQRANIWDQMKALDAEVTNRGDGWKGEESVSYDKMEADIDRLDADIERGERFEARAERYSKVERPGAAAEAPDVEASTEDDYSKVFGKFLRRGINALNPVEQKLMEDRFTTIENAAGVGSGAAGGYAVPPGFRDKFVEVMKWYGPMLDEAELIVTTTGANFQWPTNDDTGNMGAILAENTQVTEQDVTLGTASLDAYMYTSKLVRASFQIMQDSAVDFEAWLSKKLGERVGRILNNHFTTGTGTAQPDGIVTSATVGVTGTGSFASTGGVSYDNLVDLMEGLDPAYQGGAGMKFMFHQTARKALRKLKDTQGRPIWEPSVQAGIPNQLLGYGYVLNNDMPTLATSSKSILFGNIEQAYVIRLVTGLDVLRLDERYADYLQKGFLAFQRADGTMQDSNAVRVFQTTSTA